MSTPRILVVDDSLTIRRALEFILKPAGYALEFAVDGREAIDRARAFAPDLILLDYVLPDMRGPDVCANLELTAETASTPVILVSAKGASIRQAYQDARNVVSYITKPFKAEVVSSVVANALARAASATETAASQAEAAPATAKPRTSREAAESSSASTAAPRVGSRRTTAPTPTTVAETFSVLLEQLEDVIAADAADRPARHQGSPGARRLRPSLSTASARMSDVAQHLVDGSLTPFRLRADGSLASIAATLLEAHRSLCEAAIALAAAGSAGSRLPDGPRVVVIGPPDHGLASDLVGALVVAPEVPMLAVRSDFAALPTLVRLLAPEWVAIATGCDAALDEAFERSRGVRPEGTRFLGLGQAEGTTAEHLAGTLRDSESVREWVGSLARGGRLGGETAVEMGLEIVSV